MGKLKRAGAKVSNMIPVELRSIALDVGMEVIEELAERIADEARIRASKLDDVEKTYTLIDKRGNPRYKKGKNGERIIHKVTIKNRRGPNKRGNTDSGPIKDTIAAIQSPKVPLSMLVNAGAWYSHFVEFGTDPHIIKPKKAKALLFPVSGDSAVMVSKLKEPKKHPGIRKPKAFLRPAADKADNFLKDILREKGLIS